MPRRLENWLSIGFAFLLAPLVLYAVFKFTRGDALAWLAVVGGIFMSVLMYDLVAKNQLGLAGPMGRYGVLAVAIAVTGLGGYDLYRMHGEAAKDVSVLPYWLTTLAWLFAIAGPWIIFGQLGSRDAQEYFAPEPQEPAKA